MGVLKVSSHVREYIKTTFRVLNDLNLTISDPRQFYKISQEIEFDGNIRNAPNKYNAFYRPSEDPIPMELLMNGADYMDPIRYKITEFRRTNVSADFLNFMYGPTRAGRRTDFTDAPFSYIGAISVASNGVLRRGNIPRALLPRYFRLLFDPDYTINPDINTRTGQTRDASSNYRYNLYFRVAPGTNNRNESIMESIINRPAGRLLILASEILRDPLFLKFRNSRAFVELFRAYNSIRTTASRQLGGDISNLAETDLIDITNPRVEIPFSDDRIMAIMFDAFGQLPTESGIDPISAQDTGNFTDLLQALQDSENTYLTSIGKKWTAHASVDAQINTFIPEENLRLSTTDPYKFPAGLVFHMNGGIAGVTSGVPSNNRLFFPENDRLPPSFFNNVPRSRYLGESGDRTYSVRQIQRGNIACQAFANYNANN